MEHFSIGAQAKQVTAAHIKALRRCTDLSIGAIRQCLATGEPLVSIETHHNTIDEALEQGLALIATVCELGLEPVVMVDGEAALPVELEREVALLRQIGEQIQRDDDRRFA
jgi:hypothetical protein